MLRNGQRRHRVTETQRCELVPFSVPLWLLFAALASQNVEANDFPADLGAGMLLIRGFDPAAPLSTDVSISTIGQYVIPSP